MLNKIDVQTTSMPINTDLGYVVAQLTEKQSEKVLRAIADLGDLTSDGLLDDEMESTESSDEPEVQEPKDKQFSLEMGYILAQMPTSKAAKVEQAIRDLI